MIVIAGRKSPRGQAWTQRFGHFIFSMSAVVSDRSPKGIEPGQQPITKRIDLNLRPKKSS